MSVQVRELVFVLLQRLLLANVLAQNMSQNAEQVSGKVRVAPLFNFDYARLN